jgi:hypothetical protein
MEPSPFLGPQQRAWVVITNNEVQIETDANILAKKQKKTHNTKDNTIHTSRKLLVKRATKNKWSHSYADVTVVKYDLSYREDVFTLPHTKWILLSDLDMFEVKDAGKSGLLIYITAVGRETMVVYIVP